MNEITKQNDFRKSASNIHKNKNTKIKHSHTCIQVYIYKKKLSKSFKCKNSVLVDFSY